MARAAARLSRQDWLDVGAAQLRKCGPAGLTVENLCAAARRTRGSFYHHFADHGAFIAALLQRWQQTMTERIISDVECDDDAIDALNARAAAVDHRLEVRIRELAQNDAAAAAVLKSVDARRTDFIARLYRERAGVEPRLARELAEIEYAAFVGAQVLWKNRSVASRERLGALFGELVAAYLAAGR